MHRALRSPVTKSGAEYVRVCYLMWSCPARGIQEARWLASSPGTTSSGSCREPRPTRSGGPAAGGTVNTPGPSAGQVLGHGQPLLFQMGFLVLDSAQLGAEFDEAGVVAGRLGPGSGQPGLD